MIIAHLQSNKLTSNTAEAFSLYDKSLWGEKKRDVIEYTFIEALALMQEGKMQVMLSKKKITEDMLLRKAKSHDKRTEVKLAVFSDLRKRGYVVKTALKFGAEFRVYDKGIKPGQDHAMWLLYPVKEHEALTWYDFAAKSRVATSTKKKLLVGIVDDESDVTYYEISWLRP